MNKPDEQRRDFLKLAAALPATAAGSWALAQAPAATPATVATGDIAPQDRVFITNEDSNTISVINPATNTVDTTINLTSFDEDARPPFRYVTGGVMPPTTADLDTSSQSVSPRRVLVVEDREDCLAIMVELLSIEGCEVRVARDGAAAVAVADKFLPHVILLDLGLPVMDGYEAAAKIRANPRTQHALIAAVTGHGREMDKVRSASAGIDLHFVKPVAFSDLVGLLRLRGAGT